MFYFTHRMSPQDEIPLGTEEFKRIITRYVVDISGLSDAQYQTFKGTLLVFDLLDQLIPSTASYYSVGFSPDE